VHPRFSTPYVAIGLFSVLAVLMTFGNSTFLGNLYAFGAMLSFTLAHASVLWMRRKLGSDELPWRGPLSFRVGSYDLPLFAALGGIGTLISWFVTIALHFHDNVAPVGFAWLGVGMVVYVVYRRSQGLPLKRTVVAPAATLGPAIEVEYRSILMPLTAHRVTDEMTATALRLAAETGTRLIALYPVEVPLDRPLSDPMAAEVAKAERELREAAALGREYGVSVVTRIVRTRNVGEAIVEEAARRHAEIIVMGAASRRRGGERMFGRVVDYVLRNAPCRVMVGTPQVGAV
jgi:basic amino acid/polyamine antiporter, APA family